MLITFVYYVYNYYKAYYKANCGGGHACVYTFFCGDPQGGAAGGRCSCCFVTVGGVLRAHCGLVCVSNVLKCLKLFKELFKVLFVRGGTVCPQSWPVMWKIIY